ncbi:MAG: HNH endonuclease signature motif containing protein [Bacteroidales bacterium]|nr:HNH endonuclease signature motif containing protein [Bacteroidales bacterium]
MARNPNTDRNGNSFPEETRRAIWNKAQNVPGYDSNKTRKDHCGAWIKWDNYGDTPENGNGWKIDHIKPVSKGGGDELSNLQPLQWQNNRKKSDDYPASNYCIVSAK